MLKEQKRDINGVTFQVAPFMAIEGLRLQAYLTSKILPIIGDAVKGMEIGSTDSIMDTKIDGKLIAGAVDRLVSELSEEQFVNLVKRLLSNTIATWKDDNGTPRTAAFNSNFDAVFNEVFQGKLLDIFPVIKFVLEVNYPDFFHKLSPLIGKLTETTGMSESGKRELRND